VPLFVKLEVVNTKSPIKAMLTSMLMILIKILAKNAVPKLLIVNPFTIDEIKSKTRALITSKKRPKVKNVRGSVNAINIGLKIALAKPRKRAESSNAEVL